MSEYISEMFTCFGLNLQVYMKINYFKGKNMNLLFNMFRPAFGRSGTQFLFKTAAKIARIFNSYFV